MRLLTVPTPLAALVALLAGIAVLAACGGSAETVSREGYQRELDAVGARLDAAFAGIGDGAAAGDAEGAQAVAERIAAARTELEQAADDLAALQPPAEVDAPHDDLVAGLRGFAGELQALETAVRERDADAVQRFVADAASSDAVARIRDATSALEEEGFDVTGPAGG